MSEPTPPPPTSEQDRKERIAELESRLAKRPGVGVMPPVAALALAGSVWMLSMQSRETDYFRSDPTAIDLGAEGDYHFDRLVSNRYAQIHGLPTLRGVYGGDAKSPWVVVGLQQTQILVKRPTLPTEVWKDGSPPPPPDPRPFAVRGRLRAREDAGKLTPAFEKMEQLGELKPKWIIEEGAKPGADFAAMGWFGGLLAFAALNAWLLIRGTMAVIERLRKR
ncbi:MAG: hypothetical protein QM723_36675 [Myxococcaceae bacterium]